MNWDAIGAIGDFVSGVGVIVTLGYLAVQIRQSTRAQRSSTFQSICSEMAANTAAIVASPELADVFLKGFQDPDSLTPAERIRMAAQLTANARKLESVYVQSELGAITPELRAGFERSLLIPLTMSTGRAWWTSSKSMYYRPFVDYVDERLSSTDVAEGTHPTLTF